MNYDNPAERLLVILREGKKFPKTESCRKVWEHLLGVSADTALLTARLAKVMQLPAVIRDALREEFPEQGNTWGHWEAQVCGAFMSQDLQATWDTFTKHIDVHTLTYLQMSSGLLQSRANTKLVANGDLDAFKTTLNEILKELIASEQPVEVKLYLTRALQKIITTIDEYRITGALPMVDAIEATIGHAVRHGEYRSFFTDTALGERLMETLSAMANVVTVAVGVPQLGQAIALLAATQ